MILWSLSGCTFTCSMVYFPMSENYDLKGDIEFKIVSYKRKRGKLKQEVNCQLPAFVSNYTSFDRQSYIRYLGHIFTLCNVA